MITEWTLFNLKTLITMKTKITGLIDLIGTFFYSCDDTDVGSVRNSETENI